MSQGAFEKLEGPKAKKLLDRLNKVWAGSPFDTDRSVAHARTLPFADTWLLAEAADATSIPEKRCVALDNGQQCLPMNFDADFIPAFANQNNVRLTAETAPDYLRFWFEYARPGADRFVLVEGVDDMPWREEPTPQARKSLARTVMPIEQIHEGAGGFAFVACVLFRDTLFRCTMEISPQGKVEIVSREVVAEGLTVSDPMTAL